MSDVAEMSTEELLASLDTENPQLAALAAQLENLQQQVAKQESKRSGGKSVPRMTLEEQFEYDLTLTEVDEVGGRRRDRIAAGYSQTYDLLMQRVGPQLEAYVQQNGFTLQLFMATMKVYYSKEGRLARGEQPRKARSGQ